MFKTALTCLGAAALLAACAPALTAPTVGRIVNAATGQEGTVNFPPGALSGGTSSTDNVVIQIGGQTYLGRATLLAAAGTVPLRPALDVTFGAGFWNTVPGWAWGGQLTTGTPQITLRSGNLIARTTGATPRTLTCTLQVDAEGRGIGECTGSDGARYAMQF
ncbi:hypothetical protein [Deinococcus sp. YIM 77859]|uniref:hypothetical protein n=1 Tax=Deinococcus sp. YIM 77859 TaxID=1540221 RepID=UPI00054F72C0|nr:hypothetical protein [Deinococcus sp. YIM 77859]